MSWKEAAGVLRVLAEELIGAPGREAEERHHEEEIARMRAELGDMRDY